MLYVPPKMAPSVSKEELMRNTDPLIWGLSGESLTQEGEKSQPCKRIWAALNSRTCNIMVVILVFTEGLVILSEMLIDFGVVQDPLWKPKQSNCSHNSSLSSSNESSIAISPRIKTAKTIFSYISIALLTIFIVEITLKILTGKTRFLVQGIEIFDAVVVLIAFGLDVAFLVSPSKDGVGKECAVLIILLRLWRLRNVIKSIIDSSKAELGHIINMYQREKAQAEHKVDLLILKVEDLEHEVAYLKEKLKKTEKEPLFAKRRRVKDTSSIIQQKHSTITIAIETSPKKHPSAATQTYIDEDVPALTESLLNLAENKAQSILNEALLAACHSCLSTSDVILDILPNSPKPKLGAKIRRRPDGSIESGYGSNASAINWDRIKSHIRTEEKISPVPVPPSAINRCNLRCPESSPESGYGSGGSANHPRPCNVSPLDTGEDTSSSANCKQTGTVFLFPEPSSQQSDSEDHGVELEMLDELSEIERIKRVEFDPNRQEKDVPITTL